MSLTSEGGQRRGVSGLEGNVVGRTHLQMKRPCDNGTETPPPSPGGASCPGKERLPASSSDFLELQGGLAHHDTLSKGCGQRRVTRALRGCREAATGLGHSAWGGQRQAPGCSVQGWPLPPTRRLLKA